MIEKVDKLNAKQERFCERYVANNFNSIDTYLEIYDTKNRTNASIAASKILKKPSAQILINKLKKELREKEYGNVDLIIKNRNEMKDILIDIANNILTKDTDKIKAVETYLRHTNKYDDSNDTSEEDIGNDNDAKNLFELQKSQINEEDVTKFNNVSYKTDLEKEK